MAIRFKCGGMSKLLPDETLLASQKTFRAITSLAPPNYRFGFSCPLWTFTLCVTNRRVLLATEMFGTLTQLKVEPLMAIRDQINNIRGTGALQLDGSVVVEQRSRLCGEPGADDE
jgi:hypothetical protein